MPDPSLHGNGYNCPACELRREEDRKRTTLGSKTGRKCNHCNGTGRIAFTLRETYELQLADARKYYWSQKTYARNPSKPKETRVQNHAVKKQGAPA